MTFIQIGYQCANQSRIQCWHLKTNPCDNFDNFTKHFKHFLMCINNCIYQITSLRNIHHQIHNLSSNSIMVGSTNFLFSISVSSDHQTPEPHLPFRTFLGLLQFHSGLLKFVLRFMSTNLLLNLVSKQWYTMINCGIITSIILPRAVTSLAIDVLVQSLDF